jgi:hypothetical protein
MLLTLLEKLPFSQGGKVAFGTVMCLAFCSIPLVRSKLKFHDDLFSERRID